MPNLAQSIRSQFNLQTYTIEYLLNGGRFDGVTVAPQISVNEGTADYVPPDPDDGVYRRSLGSGESVGLIDLSLGSVNDGGMGDRYVRVVLAGDPSDSPDLFVDGSLFIADDSFRQEQFESDPLVMQEIQVLDGVPGFYQPGCIFVPQGAYLGIRGLAAGPQRLIRITVEVPETPWDAALLEQACCCDAASGDSSQECPAIDDISPNVIPQPVASPTLVTITGSGFRPGLAIEAREQSTGLVASLAAFTIVSENVATVLFEAPTAPANYELRVFDPDDPTGCFGAAPVEVVSAANCPVLLSQSTSSFAPGQLVSGYFLTGTFLSSVVFVEFYDTNGNQIAFQSQPNFTSQDDSQIVLSDFQISLLATPGSGVVRVISSNLDCPPSELPIAVGPVPPGPGPIPPGG